MPQTEDPDELSSGFDINPLTLFDIAKSQRRPLYAAAPMVRYSKLAFRQTVAEYGVDLTWTPMILAKEFNRSHFARESDFTTHPSAPPTILQLGVNSPLEISRTTTLLAPYVNGIDINCGCPQSWACAESLGAALMNQRSLVASMITSAKEALQTLTFDGGEGRLKKTISVKIRIHKDLRETIDFIRTVEQAGVDFITIHGRTKNTPSSKAVNLEAIKLLTEHSTGPTLSNGDVYCLDDAFEHQKLTGVDGIMSARGLLQNPGLFKRPLPQGQKISQGSEKGEEKEGTGCCWEVVETFMQNVVKAPLPFKLVLHHINEMVGSDITQRGRTLLGKEERRELMRCGDMCELIDFLDDVTGGEGLRRE